MCLWRRLSNIYKLHLGCTFRTSSSSSRDLWCPLRSMTTRLEDETSPVCAPVSSLSNVSLLSRLSSYQETLKSNFHILHQIDQEDGFIWFVKPQQDICRTKHPRVDFCLLVSHYLIRDAEKVEAGIGWMYCILVILVRISRSVCSGWGRRSTCQSEHPLENNCVIFVLLFHL